MIHYEVQLKSSDTPVPVDAEKQCCESTHLVFYARPAPGEKFEEIARFEYSNVLEVKTLTPLVYPKI